MMKKSIFIFVILSIVASALNYTAYPLFGRILPPPEYVIITVSLSLFTQISTFLSSILAITIGLSKSENNSQTNNKIELLQAFLFKIFLLVAVIFLIISPFVMDKIHTPVLFALPISLMMLFSIPIVIISGYFNGKNKMVKLGLVALISASCQFLIGITTSIISHNGLITMLSMTIAQIITIIIIFYLFSSEQLPKITKSLKTPISELRNKHMGPIIRYAALTSVAIMVIGLTQVADLLIMQNLEHIDIKFYTDIYVISRVVFFAGMIFIWPFLGEININNYPLNRKPFAKVISYFTVITLVAIIVLFFFGNLLASALFGVNYSPQLISTIGILSFLYKFFLLIITAVVLYFVVLRKYIAVWISAATGGSIFIFSEVIGKYSNMSTALVGLDAITCAIAIVGIIFVINAHTQIIKD